MYEKGYSLWYSSLYSKRETAILAKFVNNIYTFLAGDVTRTLIRGGGVLIHIFMSCPTDFF